MHLGESALTIGESMALLTQITGIEPAEMEAFIVVTVTKGERLRTVHSLRTNRQAILLLIAEAEALLTEGNVDTDLGHH